MDRREFVRRGCAACAGVTLLAPLLQGCAATRYATGTLHRDGLLLDASEFLAPDGTLRPYVVVRHEALHFPICVFRFSDADYAALWMQCAHLGAELQVSGQALQCPAHGSEYDNRGVVTNGPADQNLRRFPVQVAAHRLFIDLRATS
ncbi:Rieske 2Fe-2S domain-containing protein [Hymenobacter sp. 102]|uniref:Rieske 2Fe-2S domain-containing protein n=1 Tax=Hymenobacter sp. 102 TaxID=3403152 RepID=UPI003CF6A5EC